MNSRIKALYLAISENKAVVYSTNLKEFCIQLNNIEPESRNYDHYSRQFKKTDSVGFVSSTGKVYNLQKVEGQ